MDQPLERKIEDTRINKTIPSEMCLNHLIAKKQREREVENGLGLGGTKGFEDMGCYNCEGYDYEGSKYQPNERKRK